MRILLIGPTGGHGSIPPYLAVLSTALRALGAHVDRIGGTGVPYDPHRGAFWTVERILAAAEQLLTTVDLDTYDVISLHYGNLEIEQLLPHLWARRRKRPPAVHHVHCLAPTLFSTHAPDMALHAVVEQAPASMNGFVFFGNYARSRFTRRHNLSAPSTTSWLPTTIPPGTTARPSPALETALHTADDGVTASLYGYAAPWKDPRGLLAACAQTRKMCKIILAGPFWDDPNQAGIDLTRETRTSVQHGAAHVTVVPTYCNAQHRMALVGHSDFALFPYQNQSTFQGSGAIADYLAHAVPVLATDIANMAELVDDTGILIEPHNPATLAAAIDRLSADRRYRHSLARRARQRAHQFTAAHHARTCLQLYEKVIARRATRQ
ncbi:MULTISPECIES: glycosyltransferase family 4 protein [Nocardia]|uniref:glycosyltransferase family 4 protein n=1 Tax=Nocardia TaxID=1817 RepID=UPI00030192C4|nr:MULTISPECIES: glycosyltransferase family 4 protein [Nocardia]